MATEITAQVYPNALRAWIRYNGFTGRDVEERTGIPLRTLRTYISGGFIPYERRMSLAQTLGCSVEELMRGDGIVGTHLVQYDRGQFSSVVTGSEFDMKRRELLHLFALGASLLLSPLPALDWERVARAINRPSRLDAAVLSDLEGINGHYWRIYLLATSKSSVLDGAVGQLKTLFQFLKEPQSSPVHQQLCALVSDLAQLIGEIFFDLHEYDSAQSCYAFAVSAAREASHYDLWACALTRNAYLPVYNEHYQEALDLLEEARRVVVRGDTRLVTRFWTDSVIAEAQAGLGKAPDCLRSLERSGEVPSKMGAGSPPWLRFEGTRLPALRGSCLVRLEDAAAAIPVLNLSLTMVPKGGRRQAMILTDLAMASVQQREIEQACTYSGEVIEIASQGSSIMLREGLRKVRCQLEPFARTVSVKRLDRQLQKLA